MTANRLPAYATAPPPPNTVSPIHHPTLPQAHLADRALASRCFTGLQGSVANMSGPLALAHASPPCSHTSSLCQLHPLSLVFLFLLPLALPTFLLFQTLHHQRTRTPVKIFPNSLPRSTPSSLLLLYPPPHHLLLGPPAPATPLCFSLQLTPPPPPPPLPL